MIIIEYCVILLIIFSVDDLMVVTFIPIRYHMYYHLFYVIIAVFGCIRYTCINCYIIPDSNIGIITRDKS